jgi:integrase
MSVTVRRYRRGGWEVDIRVRLPDGTKHRRRWKTPLTSKSAAQRWGEDRDRAWYEELTNPPLKCEPKEEVPTLEKFVPRFLEGHPTANRHKPSGIASKETILRVHLIPSLGSRKLDAIGNEQVQHLKAKLRKKAAKTVNNVLTVLSVLLTKAVEWEVIDRMPCTIRQVPAPKPTVSFYDFAEFERLVTEAQFDWRAKLIVLLGGEAGLRSGEMVALEWTDIDFVTNQLCVQRSAWKGQINAPKGGRLRHVPLTRRLEKALKDHRHLRGPRVLTKDDGGPLTEKLVQNLVGGAARRANLRNNGPHILRHTFCSHLAMRSASVRAIQELAGHQDLSTTQRYMHLTPSAVRGAIRLLDEPAPNFDRQNGDILETANIGTAKANC